MSLIAIFALAATLLAAYLLLWAVAYAAPPLLRGASQVASSFAAPFTSMSSRMDVNSRRRRLAIEVDRELGHDDHLGRQARAEVVEAALEAQRIRILDRMFRSTVSKCVRAHWSVAEGLGTSDMAEAARHPICQELRQRVVDVSEMLADTIAEYPLLLDAPELIRLQVGLHRIAPTCIGCVYRTCSVSQAPRLCPPARAIECSGDAHAAIVDAQILSGD
jgi:hypothetical protein